jgi:hypothetical protein
MENWFINRDFEQIMKKIIQITLGGSRWDWIWVAGNLLRKTGKGGIIEAEIMISLVKIGGNPNAIGSDINDGYCRFARLSVVGMLIIKVISASERQSVIIYVVIGGNHPLSSRLPINTTVY